jgi:hypothetical protein
MPSNPLTFPALDNGMIAQLPVKLRIDRITRTTTFPDGTRLASPIDARLFYSWTLRFDNLSDDELNRVRDFIFSTQNGADSFIFPDPTGNLLADSANLESGIWLAPPGLTVDPFSDPSQPDAFILTNSTPAPLALTQTVSLSGPFATCFSVRARWDGGFPFSLGLTDGAASRTQPAVAGAWARHSVALFSMGAPETRTVSIIVPATTQIIVAEPQLEIAAAPGGYLKTGVEGSIFSPAWLAQSSFDESTNAPGAHSITLRIESFRNL